MRRFLLALPLLVCACQSSWPTASYSSVDPAEAQALTPAIAEFTSSMLKGSEGPIAIDGPLQDDEIGKRLPDELMRHGVMVSAKGERLQYIAEAVTGGVLLRVSVGNFIGSRIYVLNNGKLTPAGPMMVATQ